MTNPAYIPQGTAPDWIKIADNGMWSMVGDAVKQDKVNQETAAFNKQLADMFQQQSQQMHPLEMDAKLASADSSRAGAAYSRHLVEAGQRKLDSEAPPDIQRKAATEKLTAEQAKARYEQAKVAMGELAHWATAFETGGLQAIMEAPEHIRQKMVQPGIAKQVLAQAKLMAQYDPEYMKAIKLQEMREAGNTSRNNATIAGQKEIATARLTAASEARVARESAGLRAALAKQNHAQASNHLKNLALLAEQQAEESNDPNEKAQLLEQASKLRKEADARMSEYVATEIAKAAGSAGGSTAAKIDAARTVAGGTPSPVKPNPAAAVPNQTNQVRDSTKSFKTEADAQKAGAAGAFKKGDIIYINGKPVKVE